MPPPAGFSWIDKPLLGGMGRPEDLDDLVWLRKQGIQVLLSLTEEPPARRLVDEAGLLLYHVPIEDMEAPTQEQFDRAVSAIARANEKNLGVAVHCGAGLGRTGVILAANFVARGTSARDAIARIRKLRPGSIETTEQAVALEEFARRRKS